MLVIGYLSLEGEEKPLGVMNKHKSGKKRKQWTNSGVGAIQYKDNNFLRLSALDFHGGM